MVYLKKIEIEDLRCFGPKQVIDFTKDGKISQWTVILGDNGTGKTSILRSVVAMLPSPQSFLTKRDHLDTSYELSIETEWLRNWNLEHKDGSEPADIKLTICETQFPFSDKEEISMDLQFGNSRWANSTSTFDTKLFTPVFCFAYGANRKMGERSLSGEKLLKANETLFNEEAFLQNSEEYFLQIDYETAKTRKGKQAKDRVRDLLKEVLPSGILDIEVRKAGRLQRAVEVQTHFGWVGLRELSLGYRTTIAWLMDFAAKMMYYYEKSDNPFEEPAILVLDEIDLHMHPAWQREIIENLTAVFTKTQFIVTAHSPLIAQASLDSNLILLKRVGDHVKVENTPEVIKSWRIDQVLTSDLFGLKESRPKEIEKKIARRRTLLRKEVLTDKQKEELEKLNSEIDAIPIGETKAEIDAMELLKDFAEKLEASKHKK